ncbi:hypothetical protein LguiB_006091 [Lonicera macranthoides]
MAQPALIPIPNGYGTMTFPHWRWQLGFEVVVALAMPVAAFDGVNINGSHTRGKKREGKTISASEIIPISNETRSKDLLYLDGLDFTCLICLILVYEDRCCYETTRPSTLFISNGRFKNADNQAPVNSNYSRLSIATFQNLALDSIVYPLKINEGEKPVMEEPI